MGIDHSLLFPNTHISLIFLFCSLLFPVPCSPYSASPYAHTLPPLLVLFHPQSCSICSLLFTFCSLLFPVPLFPQIVLQIYQMIDKDSDPQNLPEDAAFNYLGSWSGRNRQVSCASRKMSFIVPSSYYKKSSHI